MGSQDSEQPGREATPLSSVSPAVDGPDNSPTHPEVGGDFAQGMYAMYDRLLVQYARRISENTKLRAKLDEAINLAQELYKTADKAVDLTILRYPPWKRTSFWCITPDATQALVNRVNLGPRMETASLSDRWDKIFNGLIRTAHRGDMQYGAGMDDEVRIGVFKEWEITPPFRRPDPLPNLAQARGVFIVTRDEWSLLFPPGHRSQVQGSTLRDFVNQRYRLGFRDTSDDARVDVQLPDGSWMGDKQDSDTEGRNKISEVPR